jgi:hypothetical protein
MKRLLLVVASVAVVTGAVASGALAGEVKGPPGTPGVAGSGSGQPTAMEGNANSICGFSGLNDMNPDQGQIDRITQTPKDAEPGQAASGWEVAPGVILTCNPNGPVSQAHG